MSDTRTGEPLGSLQTRNRKVASCRTAKCRMRASGARRAIEGILALTALLYLFGVVVAAWP